MSEVIVSAGMLHGVCVWVLKVLLCDLQSECSLISVLAGSERAGSVCSAALSPRLLDLSELSSAAQAAAPRAE